MCLRTQWVHENILRSTSVTAENDESSWAWRNNSEASLLEKKWRPLYRMRKLNSTDKQAILNTKFSFFRDWITYTLGNAERSMTLVGWMVYQDSIEKFEKPEHFPDQIFMGIYNIMFCRAGNIVNNVQILGGNSQLGSTPIQFTPSDYVLYFFLFLLIKLRYTHCLQHC